MKDSIFSLEGKVAVITGGSKGLGKAIALGYADAGADVLVSARSQDLLTDVVKEVEARGVRGLAVKCDVGQDKDLFTLVEAAMDTFGRIDILVNNAGISPYVKWSVDVTREMWDRIYQINLLAPFILSREAGKIMIKQKWGRVINMASAGGLTGMPGQVAYASMKGAMIQMTKTMAGEWARFGVTVNAMAPSILATELTAGVRESEQHAKQYLSKIPMGCFGEAQDAVGAAVYLASEASKYVTGTTMLIDGGSMAC